MYTYNVWDTIDIRFRRERREKALHHSSLSLNGFYICVNICFYIIVSVYISLIYYSDEYLGGFSLV